MAKLGSIKLSIDSESISNSVDITSYPVEKGSPISDHVQRKPQSINLSGAIIGPDYKSKLQKLRDIMRSGTPITYVGRATAKDVLISSIEDNRDTSMLNGSYVSIQLQFIRIAKTPWKKVKNSGKKQKVVKKSSTAVYHTIKKGDTYWGLSRKYGTSISQLRKWNKWPDRAIPIGKKARVK